jgi:hypothetical protein
VHRTWTTVTGWRNTPCYLRSCYTLRSRLLVGTGSLCRVNGADERGARHGTECKAKHCVGNVKGGPTLAAQKSGR